MEKVKRFIVQMMAVIATICIYSSCSGDDYINAIPGNANALIAVDMKAVGEKTGNDKGKFVESLFQVEDIKDCGIDMSGKLFFFETTDGNLGCCAKVADEDNLKDWLNKLAGKAMCDNVKERRGISYTLLKNSWALCFNDKALLITGPVLPAQQAEAIRTMAKCLKQKEEDGIKGSPIYEKIDSIGGSVAIVAQVDALPDKIAAPFTIGAPKGADESQIMIAATMEMNKRGCLTIEGEPFSANSDIDKALKEGTAKFRKMNGRFINDMPGKTLCSVFMNVNGKDFVQMMHNSTGLGMLLAGMNTAIDMDNILRSADGDMAIGVNSYEENNIDMTMAAQLDNQDFLKDVAYWKKSCPEGSSIENCGEKSFWFKNGSNSFWFGVSDGNEFYGSTDKELATGILKASTSPLPAEVRKVISGQKFCMILNVSRLLEENRELRTVTDVIEPLFGKINNVIYCIK